MIVFADTGILIRLLDPTDPLHATVEGAVRALRARGDELVTAPQNIAEFWNVCTRPATARGGLGFDISETDRRLGVIERTITLLGEHPAAYRLWRSLVVTHAVQGRQVHDARLVALMQAHGVTHILTLNDADFARYPGITAITPPSLIAPQPPPPTP
jgi:predicted nucleic acid-binding protein